MIVHPLKKTSVLLLWRGDTKGDLQKNRRRFMASMRANIAASPRAMGRGGRRLEDQRARESSEPCAKRNPFKNSPHLWEDGRLANKPGGSRVRHEEDVARPPVAHHRPSHRATVSRKMRRVLNAAMR